MSIMYEELKEKYEMGYISKSTLKGRVKLCETKPEKGITAEEYQLITNEEYQS